MVWSIMVDLLKAYHVEHLYLSDLHDLKVQALIIAHLSYLSQVLIPG